MERLFLTSEILSPPLSTQTSLENKQELTANQYVHITYLLVSQ